MAEKYYRSLADDLSKAAYLWITKTGVGHYDAFDFVTKEHVSQKVLSPNPTCSWEEIDANDYAEGLLDSIDDINTKDINMGAVIFDRMLQKPMKV